MRRRYIILGLLAVMVFAACHEKDEIAGLPDDKTASEMRFSVTGMNAVNIAAPGIRVLAFDVHNSFLMEPAIIPLADTATLQNIVMPPGDATIVLLGNAGAQGDQVPLASVLMPYVTEFTDIMFRLSTMSNGALVTPAQYYYGQGAFTTATSGVPQKIVVKNLCSKVDVSFKNIPPHAVDSVQMYIQNVGKEVAFNGVTQSSGQTRIYSFHSGTNGVVQADSFLVFPNVVGMTPVVDASFYLHNGSVKKFKKTLTNYNFVSNKVLQFSYNLNGVQDSILLDITVADWEGSSSELITSSLILKMNVASDASAARYTKADVVLQHYLPSGVPYTEEFHGLPLVATGSVLTLKNPIPNLDQGAYEVTGITLYDTEGGFSALSAPVSISNLELGQNTVTVNVFGRKSYENSLLKAWLKVMDGNNGNTYPGAVIMLQINSNPLFDVLTTLISNDIQTQNIDGEIRIVGLQWNGKGLTNFVVPPTAKGLTRLTTLNLSGNLLRNVDVSGSSTLSAVNLFGNPLQYLNISGCRGITSFTLTNFPYAALISLNCSGTGIQTLPTPMPALTTLLWSGCGVTQANINVVTSYSALRTLDISANQLTVYPNVQGLTLLTNYNVSGNNIVSCALPYMKPFKTENILPQRTGFNWWCP